jgi:hypothetical protein
VPCEVPEKLHTTVWPAARRSDGPSCQRRKPADVPWYTHSAASAGARLGRRTRSSGNDFTLGDPFATFFELDLGCPLRGENAHAHQGRRDGAGRATGAAGAAGRRPKSERSRPITLVSALSNERWSPGASVGGSPDPLATSTADLRGLRSPADPRASPRSLTSRLPILAPAAVTDGHDGQVLGTHRTIGVRAQHQSSLNVVSASTVNARNGNADARLAPRRVPAHLGPQYCARRRAG